MILYRPVGLRELELVYDSGMKAFPARQPQQPIFYPVLQLEYARQVASDWNTKNGQFAGYVTQFKVEDEYISRFEEHMVGGSQYQELWIPADEVEEFNRHINGHIKVVEAHFGEGFQGFVPEKFGLQGKNAVDQFTLLANSYLYKRMEFYLELKRNHKAVFLNYPFWQTYNFKNPGLKEKILEAIRQAWLTSFPAIPLPQPPPDPEDALPVEQAVTPAQAPQVWDVVEEDVTADEETDSDSAWDPIEEEDILPSGQTFAQSLIISVQEDPAPEGQTNTPAAIESVPEEVAPIEDTASRAPRYVSPVRANETLPKQSPSSFSRGIELSLRGKNHEAIAELSKAIEEQPDHVIAYTSLGVLFHRLGQEDRALSCYEAALRIDPIYAEAHYFRANLLYKQGKVREAIAGYTLAVGLKPELIHAHREPAPQDRLTDYDPALAEMYWVAKPARRILHLTALLATNPGQANLFRERAAEYVRLRNYVQAIADYSSSLEIQPDDANVYHLRGVAYEQLGQLDRALEDYQRAIAIDPQLPDAYIQRGVTFGQMGHFRQSVASLTEAIRLAPGNPDVYFNRGAACFQQGDFKNAVDDFSNVIRLAPGDEAAYYWRGMSNEAAGRQEEAIADYRKFLAISQDAQARQEIEAKLSRWTEAQPSGLSTGKEAAAARQKADQVVPSKPGRAPDLHDVLTALGKRALTSIWLAGGLNCYGEGAEELSSLAEQERPIEGQELLRVTSRIQQTLEGDFTGFDSGAASYWVFIRAWNGSGFYVETDDPKVKERLQARLPSIEEVEGANPPYEGLFLPIT